MRLSVKRFVASIFRRYGSRGAYCSPIRDMKQFNARVHLADNGAAGARWRNTERRRVLYDDGGAHDGALAVSAKDCACITHAAAESRRAV